MKLLYETSSHYLSLFLLILSGFLNAQEKSKIFDDYDNYIEAPREIVYLHLNKSTYIKGEPIGFTAYVLNKKDKKPSLATTNLYVSIEDDQKKVITKKLIRVYNGVASNLFTTDSLFSSGFYNIKAYTNWMQNFNEHNYHSESIRVIDPETEKYIDKPLVDNTIDAQFLPESGHLLDGVLNKVGVIIKDSQGFGLPNAIGKVVGKDNETLTTFKTNELGVGSFSLMVDRGDNYNIKIKHANENFNFPLGHDVEKNGVIISVKRLQTKLFASVTTNQETLEIIKNKHYTLMMHNGNNYGLMDIHFNDNTVVTKVIDYNSIPSGINILTLFNEDDIPVAERLFFNYNDVDVITSNEVSASSYVDSLTVKLNFKEINPNIFNNISISVLPEQTASYNSHNSVLSHVMLRPYIKGPIENGGYYFENINDKKRYDLDNLLLTQGWSSYDWNNMFLPEKLPYAFEQGVALKANINNEKHLNDVYVLHHFGNNEPQYKRTSNGNRTIIFENLFPNENDLINVSRLQQNSELVPAQLYLQTLPNTIPNLKTSKDPLLPKSSYKIMEHLNANYSLNSNLENVQVLDEVFVESSIDNDLVRARKIGKNSYGDVKVISETDKLTFLYLEDYLASKRVFSGRDPETGEMTFDNGRWGNRGPMTVFFNDMPLTNTNFLFRFPLTDIDYVEINRGGLGEGFRGLNGVLRIYSSYSSTFSSNRNKTAQEYKPSLTFASRKNFYVPKYQNYNDDFFKGYGTIAWNPELAVDQEGNISFKILKPQVPITLFIEGIANDGAFIFEKKSISLN